MGLAMFASAVHRVHAQYNETTCDWVSDNICEYSWGKHVLQKLRVRVLLLVTQRPVETPERAPTPCGSFCGFAIWSNVFKELCETVVVLGSPPSKGGNSRDSSHARVEIRQK